MFETKPKLSVPVLVGLSLLMLTVGVFAGLQWTAAASVSPERSAAHDHAYAAVARGDWDAALEHFEQLKQVATKESAARTERDEIEAMLKVLKLMAPTVSPANVSEPEKSIATGTQISVSPPETPPPKIREDDIPKRFPVGKTVQSVAHLMVTGKGTNTEWGVKGTSHFSYIAQIAPKTKVLKSDAKTGELVFEQSFGLIIQELVVSDEALELVFPDSLPVRVLWPAADGLLLRDPRYRIVRKFAGGLQTVDPGLKKMLTTIHGWLKRSGLSPRPTDELPIRVKINELSGTKFRIVYLSGTGVVSITPLVDTPFTAAELIRIAGSCNVVLDYLIVPNTDRPPGESWDVQASEIGNLFAFHDPIAEFSGSVTFVRGSDDSAKENARLEIQRGKVRARSTANGSVQETNMVIERGTALFNLKHLYLRRASTTCSYAGTVQSQDHLLFGTERMRDLKIESRYEAELPDAEEAQSSESI